jgi:hypothetical protein
MQDNIPPAIVEFFDKKLADARRSIAYWQRCDDEDRQKKAEIEAGLIIGRMAEMERAA